MRIVEDKGLFNFEFTDFNSPNNYLYKLSFIFLDLDEPFLFNTQSLFSCKTYRKDLLVYYDLV